MAGLFLIFVLRKSLRGYFTQNKNQALADWIDANQLGRRNLTPDQMSLIRGRRYNRMKKAKGFQEAGPGRGKTLGHFDPMFSTAEILAKQYGVSAATKEKLKCRAFYCFGLSGLGDPYIFCIFCS